jgi:Ni2+-binding GTPase involved in maturation of urease and hydrogenase
MKIHLLTGFLGSGKTTAIQLASRLFLQKGIRVGVITNDQGIKLVDSDFFKALDIPGRQVVNGCFCCNYNDLDAGIQSLIETNNTEVIFAESVGSCTDIVATVLKPLLHARPGSQITVSTFTDVRLLRMILDGRTNSFDESVRYIYLKQLEEAGIVILNKIDLVSREELGAITQIMQERYVNKVLLYQNSLDEDSIHKWLRTLNDYGSADGLSSLSIDYDIYAAGEAQLAWFDQELEIYSRVNHAIVDTENLINSIYKRITSAHYPIGHLKFLVNNAIKIGFVSNNESMASLNIVPNANGNEKGNSASLLINIRVQTSPEKITQLITEAVRELEIQSGCKIIVNSLSSFQPGYPKPVHRL